MGKLEETSLRSDSNQVASVKKVLATVANAAEGVPDSCKRKEIISSSG
jgi:hypothetical protein